MSGPLLADQVEHDLSAVRMGTVFEDIDTLPGPESQPAAYNRYRQLYLRQRGFQVSRHVIGAFRVMFVGTILRRDPIEVGLNVDTHCRVGVLLNKK